MENGLLKSQNMADVIIILRSQEKQNVPFEGQKKCLASKAGNE